MANITGFNTGGGSGNARKPYIKGGWNDPNRAEVVTPVYKGGWNDPNRAEVVTPVFTDPTTKKPTTGNTSNYGYNGGTGSSTNAMATPSNAYADYIAALQAARADAIAKANAAVDEQTSAAEGRYRNQLTDIRKDYQDLRNQSEVNRYKAIRKQREALANQGRLDGGAGRMENTVLRNNFDNNLNEINLKEASEKRQVESAINELYAQAAALKAQNEMATLTNFGDALMYGMQNNPSYAYNPATSDYYNAASNLANTSYTPINAVSDGQTARATTAALQQAFEELSRNPLPIGDYTKKFSWI